MKMNEPMGRFGSFSPARERRTAFATAVTASSCPITRLRRLSSIRTSFWISDASIFVTGTPVHFDTISAMSSSVTSSRSSAPPFCISASFAVAASMSRSSCGSAP
jgi:hypothetical protein